LAFELELLFAEFVLKLLLLCFHFVLLKPGFIVLYSKINELVLDLSYDPLAFSFEFLFNLFKLVLCNKISI
jgi:hypothetical protein